MGVEAGFNFRGKGRMEMQSVMDIKNRSESTKHYLLASDFDQTLSFNDSGLILSELLGTTGFGEKVAGLSNMNLVQQGGELAYLLLHDPESVSYTHLRAHETPEHLVCRLLL